MKVLAFLGSPRNGNSTAMVNAVCKGAASAGHEIEIINLASLKISECTACYACKSGKFEYCAIKDDMQELYTKIIEADCLVFGTPVFTGQMSGLMKLFFDRWYPFLGENYDIYHLPGKKYITITASGAPAAVFQSLTDYFNHWLGSFFKMVLVQNIVGGELGPADAINSQPELLAMAENAGRALK